MSKVSLHSQLDSKLIYLRRIVADPHYPYSVRRDLRLRDAIKDQNISKYTLIQVTSKSSS